MNKMVVSNLVHRPVRTAISVLAIGIEVTLILLIVGLLIGIMTDSAKRTQGIGADVMVSPPGTTAISAISGAPAPIKIADRLRKLDHVAAVAPVITQLNTTGNVEILYGIDLDPNSPNNFNGLANPFEFLSGGPFANNSTDQIIVDDYIAQQNHIKIGDKQELLNHTFTVCGIVLHGKGARKFLPIHTMQELIGAQDKATMFYVRVNEPSDAEGVVAAIKAIPGMEKYGVRSIAAYLSQMTVGTFPGLSKVIDVVIGVAVIIGFIVIFQSMYTAVMERTREIGILKALGASKFYIVNVMLREALLLAVAGVALGIGISFMARMGIRHKFPLMTVMFTGYWIMKASMIALVGALIGALYPALKAAQKDPIDALAYE
jgi:putative ABC transport system permease protein